MKLYHASDDPQAVLDHGFRDDEGFYHQGKLHRGVWFFDIPMEDEHAYESNSRTIVVDIPDDVAVRHEWLEEVTDYRRFLIPAEVANRYFETGIAGPGL